MVITAGMKNCQRRFCGYAVVSGPRRISDQIFVSMDKNLSGLRDLTGFLTENYETQ